MTNITKIALKNFDEFAKENPDKVDDLGNVPSVTCPECGEKVLCPECGSNDLCIADNEQYICNDCDYAWDKGCNK